jgi:hypothetical protein
MQFPAIEFENESELKRQFAEVWLTLPDDPFKAACNLFGSDYGKASFVAQKWVIDPEVLAFTKAILKERGPKAFLPTKEDLAHKVFKSAENAFEDKDKATLYKLYAEIMGFIEKPIKIDPIQVEHTVYNMTDEQLDKRIADLATKTGIIGAIAGEATATEDAQD